MRGELEILSGVLVTAALLGCAADTERDHAPFDRSVVVDPVPLPEEREARSGAAGVESRRGRLAQGLTLEEAQQIALEANPALLSNADAVDAARARITEAGNFTNPVFSFGKSDYPLETLKGSDTFLQSTRKSKAFNIWEAQTTWTISKDLDVSLKRVARVDAALEGERQTEAQYVAAARSLRAAVHVAYAQVLVAERNQELAREGLAMAKKSLEVVSGRAAGGNALPAERLRAESDAARAETDLAQADRDLGRAERALATLLGDPDATLGPLRGELPLSRLPEALDDASLERDALEKNADVIAARRAVRAAEANLRLQERSAIPDITVSVGYNRYFRDPADTANFSIGFPLPILDQNRAQVAEATALLHQAEKLELAAENATRQGVRDDLVLLRASQARIDRLEREILPRDRKAVELIEAAFQGGKVLYLDVIAARQTFNQARADYVNELSSYEAALADLERLLGSAPR